MTILNDFHDIRQDIFRQVSKKLSVFAPYPEIEVEFRLKRTGILVEQFQRTVDWFSNQAQFKLVSDEKTLDITFHDENYKVNPNESHSNVRFTLTGGQISEYCRTDRLPLKTKIMFKRPVYWNRSADTDIPCSSSSSTKSDKEVKKNPVYKHILHNRDSCHDSYADLFDIRCSANVELELSEKDNAFAVASGRIDEQDESDLRLPVWKQLVDEATRTWTKLLEKVNGAIAPESFSRADLFHSKDLASMKKNFRLKHRKRFELLLSSEDSEKYDIAYIDFTRVKTGKTKLLRTGQEITEPVSNLIDSDIARQEESYEIEVEIVKTTREKTMRTIQDIVYSIFYTNVLPIMFHAPATTMYSTQEESFIRALYTHCIRRYIMELPVSYFSSLAGIVTHLSDASKYKDEKSRRSIMDVANKEVAKLSPIRLDMESSYILKESGRMFSLSAKKLKDATDSFERTAQQIRSNKFSEFISPKVVSIQMNNIRPENVDSIHYNYTVTDKADGISAMLFSIGSSIWSSIQDDYEEYSKTDEWTIWSAWFKRVKQMVGDTDADDDDGVFDFDTDDTDERSIASDYIDILSSLAQGTYHLIDSNMQVYPTFLYQSTESSDNVQNASVSHSKSKSSNASNSSDEWKFQLLNGEYMASTQRTSEVGFIGIYDCYICDDVYIMTSALDAQRIPSMRRLVNRIPPASPSDNGLYLSVFAKQFWTTDELSIHEASNKIWSAYRQNQLMDGRSYHLDGLIYTPSNTPVGFNAKQEFYEPNYGRTWAMNIKWKPAEENTIDFYVTFEKETLASYNGQTVMVDKIYEKVVQSNGANTVIRYKKAHFYNGKTERGVLQPEEFRPSSEKYNTRGNYEVHLPVTFDAYTGREECMSHDGRRIENDSVIEVGYMNTDSIQYAERWYVLRTRYDKTQQYKRGRNTQRKIHALLQSINASASSSSASTTVTDVQRKLISQCISLANYTNPKTGAIDVTGILKDYPSHTDIPTTINYGNHIDVAKNIWRSIHFPVTEDMICTGQGIPVPSEEDQMYYKNDKHNLRQKSLTIGLRDFHNTVVKTQLLLDNAVKYCRSKFGEGEPLRLIDFTCGKGGDVHKWNQMGLSYVMGVDLFHNNIHDNDDGAIVRYNRITDANKYKADFFVADSSIGWSSANGKRAFHNEREWTTYKERTAGGKKFHIATLMFSLHYFFKNADTLAGIMTNIKDHLVPGGIVIGVCFDGDKVYQLFNTTRQSRLFEINNQPACMISPDFMKGRDNVPASLKEYTQKYGKVGIGISVYNYSIQQVIPEYLVSRRVLDETMHQSGLRTLTESDGPMMNLLPPSYSKRPVLSDELIDLFQYKSTMSDVEKEVSYLNQYFFYVHEAGRIIEEITEEKPKKRVSKKAEMPKVAEAPKAEIIEEKKEEKPKKRVSKKAEKKPIEIHEEKEEKTEEKPKKRVSKKAEAPAPTVVEEPKAELPEEKKEELTNELREKLVTLHGKIVGIMKQVNFNDSTSALYIYDMPDKIEQYTEYCVKFLNKYDVPLYTQDAKLAKLVADIRQWKKKLSEKHKTTTIELRDEIKDEDFEG
jgi:hypothetical protein